MMCISELVAALNSRTNQFWRLYGVAVKVCTSEDLSYCFGMSLTQAFSMRTKKRAEQKIRLFRITLITVEH